MKVKSIFIGCGLLVLGGIIAIFLLGSLAFPAERTYTEAQINDAFEESLANSQDADNQNRLTDLSVSLQDGVAIIRGEWEEGQTLRGEIVVTDNGKSLRSQNIEVDNVAPIAEEFLEKVADAVIQAGLNNVVVRQGQIKEARIEENQIVVKYR